MKLIDQYRGLRRELYILLFGRMVTAMGNMIWPLMALILSQKMEMNASLVASVLAVGSLILLPVDLLGGKLADHFNKKAIIVCFDILSVACYLICSRIPVSWVTVVLIMAAASFQEIESPTYMSLTADLSRTEDRERAYSLTYMTCNLGFMLAPTLGGILFVNHLSLLFAINGVSILISTILIFFLIPDFHREEESGGRAVYQEDRSRDSMLTVMKENRIVLGYLAVNGMFWAAYRQVYYLLPLELAAIYGDRGAVIFGTLTSANCVVVVLFTPVLTAIFSKTATLKKSLMAGILLLVSFAAFGFFPGILPLYYAVCVVFTLGEVLDTISHGTYLSTRIPASHRGRINGTASVFQGLLIAAVMQLSGLALDRLGSRSTWGLLTLFCLAIVLGSLILIPMDRRRYGAMYEEEGQT